MLYTVITSINKYILTNLYVLVAARSLSMATDIRPK